MSITAPVPTVAGDFARNSPDRRTKSQKISDALRGKPLSPEHRAKLSAAKKGKPLSEKHRAAISRANRGRKLSPEHREKAAAICRKNAANPEFRRRLTEAKRGKPRPPEVRAKLSAALKDRPITWPRKRPGPPSPEHRAKLSAAMKAWAKDHRDELAERRRHKPSPTSLERLTMAVLDGLDIHYEFQKVMGGYCIDFLLAPGLALECDGTYWHSLPGAAERDHLRDAWLKEQGIVVVRVDEQVIKRDPVGAIENALNSASEVK